MVDISYKACDMKILLVDDTPQNLDVLSKTLRPEGYQLAIAQNGENALKIAVFRVARRFHPLWVAVQLTRVPFLERWHQNVPFHHAV